MPAIFPCATDHVLVSCAFWLQQRLWKVAHVGCQVQNSMTFDSLHCHDAAIGSECVTQERRLIINSFSTGFLLHWPRSWTYWRNKCWVSLNLKFYLPFLLQLWWRYTFFTGGCRGMVLQDFACSVDILTVCAVSLCRKSHRTATQITTKTENNSYSNNNK